MTAEITHGESYFPEDQASPPHITPGSVIPMPRRSPESSLEPKEQQMLEAFRQFSMTTIDLDPRTMDPEQMPNLSFATHDFLTDVGKRSGAIAGQKAVSAATRGDLSHLTARRYLMPKEAVNQSIRDHYQQFGTRRRSTSDELRGIEEKVLASAKRPLRAGIYDDGDRTVETPIKRVSNQAALYPEIVVGISLENALRTTGQEIAADSVEVVLAAYGTRLGRIRAAAIAERGVVRESIMGRTPIYEPDVSQLDPDMQAEKPPRRKKE